MSRLLLYSKWLVKIFEILNATGKVKFQEDRFSILFFFIMTVKRIEKEAFHVLT